MTPDGMQAISWTDDDIRKDIAIVHLRRTETASHHIVRLSGAEIPHIHDHSDLTVTVLSGKVRMNLGDEVQIVGPGQVIDIPRGTAHFAENIAPGASEAYAVFSPPLDKADNRPLKPE